jgi:hypothetical protein
MFVIKCKLSFWWIKAKTKVWGLFLQVGVLKQDLWNEGLKVRLLLFVMG